MASLRALGRSTTRAPHRELSRDHVVVLHGFSWSDYKKWSKKVLETSGIRTTYLDGEFEIMSPGRQHEHVNRFIARLAIAFAEERGLSINDYGSETFQDEAEEVGLEADTSFVIGPERPFADLAIEVVITSRRIDKLEACRRLKFREVWFWQDGKLSIHVLGATGAYRRSRTSRVLRGFPVDRVEKIVNETDRGQQTEAVVKFRRSLV